jgi:hypothetical protein
MRYPRPDDSLAASEQARVRAHLDSAERELRAEPVKGLSVSQRAARARALDRLHEYWVRGVFPQNTDFPRELTPYFIDLHHTRCAMAYLIEQSGARDFVARVAATHNNARISSLRGDSALGAWLDENGLTLADAARIQPSYDGCLACVDCCVYRNQTSVASTGYQVATAMLVSADVVTVMLNVEATHQSRAVRGAVGLGTGLLSIMIGVPNIDESGSKQTLGWVNTGMGAVSAAFGAYGLLQRPTSAPPVSFAPWVASNGAPGLSGRITF